MTPRNSKTASEFSKVSHEYRNTKDSGYYYNLACFHSILNERSNACSYLSKSIEKGYKNYDWIMKDPDFNNMRNEGCYQKIVKNR